MYDDDELPYFFFIATRIGAFLFACHTWDLNCTKLCLHRVWDVRIPLQKILRTCLSGTTTTSSSSSSLPKSLLACPYSGAFATSNDRALYPALGGPSSAGFFRPCLRLPKRAQCSRDRQRVCIQVRVTPQCCQRDHTPPSTTTVDNTLISHPSRCRSTLSRSVGTLSRSAARPYAVLREAYALARPLAPRLPVGMRFMWTVCEKRWCTIMTEGSSKRPRPTTQDVQS